MATIRDVVNGAIRRIIRDLANDPSPEESADGLTALNDMLHAMPNRGVHLNWETKDLTDTFPLEDADIEGVKALLAKKIADDYGKPVPAQVDIDARRGFAALYKRYHIFEAREMDPALRNFQANRRFGY